MSADVHILTAEQNSKGRAFVGDKKEPELARFLR